ncbi:MAG: sigma-54-dependent transcriptional regulator, partial [Bacteroidales bacterium]
MVHRILIVEDDPAFALMLRKWLEKNNFEPTISTNIARAKKEIETHSFSLILSDLRLPDGEGSSLPEWLKSQQKSIPIILLTGYADIQSAVTAIKNGAFDYLEKPVNPSLLKQKIEQALSMQRDSVTNTPGPDSKNPVKTQTNKPLKENPESRENIEGDSPAVKLMYQHIRMVAPTRMSVMILGESGTGKEYAARLIHEHSDRRGKPFIAVDCGSLGKELAPS